MKFLNRSLDWIATAPLFALFILANVAVFMRYWMDRPMQSTEELSGLLMIWIVMLGAIVAERDDQHLSIPLLTDLLPARLQAAVSLVVSLLSAVVLLYVAWLGFRLAAKVQFKVTDILQLSWFWIDIAVPIGCVGIAFFTLYRAMPAARLLFSGSAK